MKEYQLSFMNIKEKSNESKLINKINEKIKSYCFDNFNPRRAVF